MTTNSTPPTAKTPKSARQIVIVALLVAIICGSAAAIWWYRPANAEHRYSRMSLVSLKQLLDGDPNNAKAWRQFAIRLAHDGDATLAEPALTRALELNPNDPILAAGLAELWIARGKYAEAFQLLKMTTAVHPKDAAANRALGKLYLGRGSFQRAYDVFEIVAEADPTADDARYQQAVCSMEMHQPAQAQADIKKALAIQQNNPAYLALEGSADAAAGNADSGITELEHAAQLAPKEIAIQAELINLLLAQHRSAADVAAAEEAIAHLEQLSPDYPSIPLQRAKLELLKRNWQSAARYFEMAMKATPQVDSIYIGLNQAYKESGRASEANKMLAEYQHRLKLHGNIRSLAQALSVNPNDIDAYGSIAALEMQLGNTGEAAEAIKDGLRIDPANTRLQAMQNALGQATAPPK